MKLIEEMLGDVQRFTEEIIKAPIAKVPGMVRADRFPDKVNHLQEELAEFEAADNWADQADAMIDIIYVALGTLVEMGVAPGSAFNEVHNANMEKIHGVNSARPEAEYDAVKPNGWNPPELAAAMPLHVLKYLSPVLLEVTRLRADRGATYNNGSVNIEDYFPLGDESYFQMCHVKLLRCRSIMEGGSGEIMDSLLDLINYTTFWAEWKNGGGL